MVLRWCGNGCNSARGFRGIIARPPDRCGNLPHGIALAIHLSGRFGRQFREFEIRSVLVRFGGLTGGQVHCGGQSVVLVLSSSMLVYATADLALFRDRRTDRLDPVKFAAGIHDVHENLELVAIFRVVLDMDDRVADPVRTGECR